jgi:hypothetical protein
MLYISSDLVTSEEQRNLWDLKLMLLVTGLLEFEKTFAQVCYSDVSTDPCTYLYRAHSNSYRLFERSGQ